MCGIAATIGNENPELIIRKILDKIHYRGQGMCEYCCFDKIGLGTQRLAIVDAPNGKQPIWNREGNIGIVFNGEIYNSDSLRLLLTRLGYNFSTKTDTEVVLHLYDKYGEECLTKLDGMFAFFIYDRANGEYFAARDRYGVKPFYYAYKDGNIIVASEAKALLFDSKLRILELKPGELLTKSGPRMWYKIPHYDISDSYKTSTEIVQTLVMRAVKKRVSTNHPIAVFLSGGIDSSIVLYATKKNHDNTSAITIGFPGASDIENAKIVCKTLDVKLHICTVTLDDIVSNIESVIFHSESFEPNMIRAGIFSYLLAREAEKLGFKIAICGEGADEIFGGYGDFVNCNDYISFQNKTMEFMDVLYKTQLKRIDRLCMAFTVEVREPFMDSNLVEYALNLPYKYKFGELPAKGKVSKLILRDAFKNQLPDKIVWREKVTMMKGAGLGHVNSSENLLYRYAEKAMDDREYYNIKNEFKEYGISNKEEALYFKIYYKYYKKRLSFDKIRPYTAKNEM